MLTDFDVRPTLPPQVDDPFSAVRVVGIITGIAALWLAGTPALYFGVNEDASAWNEWTCGGLILCLVVARLLNPARTTAVSFFNAGIAAWVIVSPWVLGFASINNGRWQNDVWVGTAILMFASFSGSFTYLARNRRNAATAD